MFLNSFSGVVVVLFKLFYYFVFMAVIQFSGLVSGIQGKLNGSVLSKGRNGQVIYNRPTQRKEPTAAQLNIRAGFSAASYYWNDFTNQQKLDWDQIAEDNPVPDRFGNPTVLSGFDYFKRMMQLTFPEGTSTGIIPDLSGDAVYEHTPVSAQANFSITDQGFQINSFEVIFETINDSPEPNLVNLYISLPVRDNSRPYFRTWYLVKQFQVAASLGASEQVILDGTDILMPSGWRAFDGTPQLFKTIAFIPSQGGVSVEQIYPFIMSKSPSITLPTFNLITDDENAYFIWRDTDDTKWFMAYSVLTQPSDNWSNYRLLLQWAAPQFGTAPPAEGDFAALINIGITFFVPDTLFFPSFPIDPDGNAPQYMADFSSEVNGTLDNRLIPVRSRLYNEEEDLYTPWQLEFCPIVYDI